MAIKYKHCGDILNKFIWNKSTVSMDGELYDKNESKNTFRYCLKGNGENPLIVIGLNPSTADNEKPDPTMKAVVTFVEKNGFDGFLMINLYPLRTPSPAILKQKGFDADIHKKNMQKIDSYLKKINEPTILLAFGAKIEEIKFLKKCLIDIVEVCQKYNPKWMCLKKTNSGHPCHPLYLKRDLPLISFDIFSYIENL